MARRISSGTILPALFAAMLLPHAAEAATQCINQNAPNPIELCVTDSGRPSVFVQQPNGRTQQYYGQNSWGSIAWLNGTSTASKWGTGYLGGPTVTNVSNTLTGTGTAADPWTITNVTNLGASGVQMTQVFRYVSGDRTLRKTFTLTNNGASTFNDLRFFHGGDTFFGGDDDARGWYDTSNNMVYVTNTTFTNSGLMGYYANPATPSSRYFAGAYNTGDNYANVTAQLPNTSDSNFQDAGYYLQWNRASLAPTQTWTIDSYEVWSAPGAVQVLSPASDYVFPGTTVSRTFRVQNLTTNPLTISWSAVAAPDGWTVTIPNGNSALVNGLAIVNVPVEITVPPGAALGSMQDVSLTATASPYTGVGSTRLTILQSDYTLSPGSLAFGAVSPGNTSDLSITLTNGAGGLPVQIGTVAGVNALAAPFSIVSNTCSNTTVAASGSCVVTVRYTPVSGSSSDTFSFPVLSPVITTQTIAVTGTAAAPSSFTVTSSAGAGGSITPPSVSVNSGNTTAFTVTPNTGYSIASVTGCGGSLVGNTYTTGAISGACAVSATFSLNSYTVSASAGGGGGISPGSANVNHGATTSFTVTPNTGFSIGSVTGCGGSLAGNTYTTGAISGACTVSATFSLNSYAVSASAGTGGGVSPGSANVNHGATTSFTVTPDTGYSIASVTGCGGSLAGNTYTTGAISGACAVSASFSLNSYTVSASAGAGGGVSPGSTNVNHGATTSFTVTPNTGYSIASVTGCGGSLAGNTYTTGVVTGACAVSASFSLNSYTVSASAGTGGGVSPGSANVNHGATTSFTITPDTGYSIGSVTGCGGSLAGNTYTTGVVTGACAVSASFTLNQYAVSASAGTGGGVSPGSANVNHGSTTSFTVTPNTGYSVGSVTGCGGSLAGNTYTTGVVTGACAVSANFTLNQYTVSASAGTGGGVSPGSANVNHGATTSFTVTPNTGYSIGSVTGCGGSLAGNTYTTGVVTGACAVSASFSLNHYTVTANSGSNGLVSPGSVSIAHGASTSFTVTPDNGFSTASVTGCGGSLAGETYTTGAITGACTVSSSFSRNSYTVTANAGTGGGISPASISVSYGGSTSFVVTPDTGYSIASVTGCGGSLAGDTYTTGVVSGACTVSASFSLNSYTVTADGGSGGLVSPGSVNVNHGATTSFTLTPDDGYSIETVSGCGGSLAGNTFTTGTVTGACAVSASFTLTRPVFTPATPATFTLNSTGLVTPMPAGVAPTAVDLHGNPLTVTLVGGQTEFAPGAYTLTWRAVDSRGVVATVEQILHVWPIVSVGHDVSVGYSSGDSGSFRVALNGPAPVYPFDVSFAVSGYLQDHDLASGSVEFVNGEVEKDVYFAVTANAAPGTPSQQARVELDDTALNLGTRRALAVTLTTVNVAATVSVHGSQQGETRSVFSRAPGAPVTLTADILDPNSDDTHTVSWQAPAGAQISVVGGQLVFDPSSLPAGPHRFTVTVSDNGSPATATTLQFDIVVMDTVATLPPGSAGWAPSGLPAHPDYSPETRNVLPERSQELGSFLIEADPGIQLVLGSRALQQGLYQAELVGAARGSLAADTVGNTGGVFDFEMRDLPRVGQSASVVIAQATPIGENAVYRIYDPASGAWQSFASGPADSIASAPSVGGVCPPPGSTVWRTGLNTGDGCVRMTISDGGPNDSDRAANGNIVDTSGVAQMNQVTVKASGEGKRGGGAMDSWFIALGVMLLALRGARRRWLGGLLACALPLLATAGEGGAWYVGGQWGAARGDASANQVNAQLAELGYDVTVDYDDRSRSAWKVFGGYQFSRYLGVQAGYTNLGDVDSSLTGNIIDVDQLLVDVTRIHPHSADGFEAAVTGRYPFSERFAATGRLGLFLWDSSYSALNELGDEFASYEQSGTDLSMSIGMEYQLGAQWTLAAEWNRYDVDGETVSLIGIGARFSFAMR